MATHTHTIISVIVTAKMNDVDPQAWLADMLAASPGIRPSVPMTCCLGTRPQLSPSFEAASHTPPRLLKRQVPARWFR